MSDLPNELPSSVEEPKLHRETPAAHRRNTKKRKAPVYTYLIILFLAAFILLAMSYFMQQRKLEGMDESLAGLKESVSAMQSVQTLREENEQLQQQLDELTQQVEELTKERDELQASSDSYQDAADQLAEQTVALEWLRQIQYNYDRQYYRYARPMIQDFEAAGLAQYLPTASVVTSDDLDMEAPADTYARIVKALFPDGVPAKDGVVASFHTTMIATANP